MSLLMDALKKAERARAARLDGEADNPPGEAPMSLDPMEGFAEDGTDRGAESNQTPPPEADATGFGLDDHVPAESVRPGLELEPETDDDSLQLGLTDEQLNSVEDPLLSSGPRGLDDSSVRNLSDIDDATAATLPSLRAARDSVHDYFDGTNSASLSMEHAPPPGDDATITGQRAVLEREAQQQSARAVFAAKATRKPSSGGRWVLFLGLPLVLGLAAVGSYFYWLASGGSSWSGSGVPTTAQAAPRPPIGPRARPSTGAEIEITRTNSVPANGTRASGAATIAATGTAPVAGSAASVSQSRASAAQATALPTKGLDPRSGTQINGGPGAGQGQNPAAQNLASVPPASGDLSPRTAIASAEPAPGAAAAAGPPILTDAQFREMLRRTSPVPNGLNNTGGIKVTRRQARDPSRTLLQRAYNQYVSGDFFGARTNYQTVLKHKPNDRDALLGVGAISTLTGELDKAKQYYLRVLNLNPRDPIAQSALIDLYTDADPVVGETQLKALIDADPGAGYLKFSLGNIYARQARWPQAQEAYFHAFRSDAGNPDYAFNLAVSLDQLGQRKAALQYYQNALALSDERPANFGLDAALARVRAIGQR